MLIRRHESRPACIMLVTMIKDRDILEAAILGYQAQRNNLRHLYLYVGVTNEDVSQAEGNVTRREGAGNSIPIASGLACRAFLNRRSCIGALALAHPDSSSPDEGRVNIRSQNKTGLVAPGKRGSRLGLSSEPITRVHLS